jgi:diaminopimelate decarboxylase
MPENAIVLARPPAFDFRPARYTAVLQCENVPLPRLAGRYGTPLYVYSATAILERYRAFDAAFDAVPHTICYSVKANSSLALLKLLAAQGAGFDIVSGGELERVHRAARRALPRTVFSGVGKTQAEIDAALRAGILIFNVESEPELLLLAARAAALKKTARVAVRVNPDVSAETHPYISTGLHDHKFGVSAEEAPRLYQLATREKWLRPEGISVHIGSQILSADPFRAAMERVAELARELAAAGIPLRYVDAGGGLGVPYWSDHAELNFAQRARAYAAAVTAPFRKMRGVHLLLEPGRALVAPAGALLTRVLYLKRNRRKRFVVVDAAMNDLIRPALYGAHHDIVPVTLGFVGGKSLELQATRQLRQRARSPHHILAMEKVDVVGPVCETGDFFARDRRLPPLAPGDLLAILDAGAYGQSLASNYNSRPRAAEVLVRGSAARLIRRRETLDDLLAPEL